MEVSEKVTTYNLAIFNRILRKRGPLIMFRDW